MKLTKTFELAGEEVTGRCTFRAINSFEESTGMSVSEAFEKLASSKLPFSIVARAVWAFINGERVHNGDRPISFDIVGQKMHAGGFMNYMSTASDFFLLTLPDTSKADESKEPQKKSSE